MGSVPEHSCGRQLVPLVVERRHARRELIQHYRNDKAYKTIVACDIRPAWQRLLRVCDVQALADAADAAQERIVYCGSEADLKALAEWHPPAPLYFVYLEEARDQHPAIRQYVEMVYARGVARLGLLSNGQPARWAAAFVHASVSSPPYAIPEAGAAYWTHPYDYPDDPETDPDDKLIANNSNQDKVAHARIDLSLDQFGAIAVMSEAPFLEATHQILPARDLLGGHTLIPVGQQSHVGIFPARKGYGLDDETITALEQFVLEELRRWVAEVRSTRADRMRNQRSLTEWRKALVPLYRHLFHAAPVPDRADRERLRRLAALIGIDFPRAAQKQAPESA